jgi:rubrerythrin
MRTSVAGPHFQAHAGDEIDIAEEHAKPLVDGGYAEHVRPVMQPELDETEEDAEAHGEDEFTEDEGEEDQAEAAVNETPENAAHKRAKPHAKAKKAGK